MQYAIQILRERKAQKEKQLKETDREAFNLNGRQIRKLIQERIDELNQAIKRLDV